MNDSLPFATELDDLAVIEISGADAASFLHSQLTHDVAHLSRDAARLAGYCTPKGRLLATLVLWRADDTETPVLRALIKADIAPAVVKRLSMYVLRAKAKLRLTGLKAVGVCLTAQSAPGQSGDHALGLPAALASDMAALPAQAGPWTVVHTAAGVWIAAPSADPATARWWHVAGGALPADDIAGMADMKDGAAGTAHGGAAWQTGSAAGQAMHEAWQSQDIAAGLPWIVAATQDVFIPQTLNLDLIDGVSFTKGCYPGQEVVARSHYRGTVKRRMACGVAEPAVAQDPGQLPGSDIYDAHRPDNPCGRVINAAGRGKTYLLLELQLADLDSAAFRLGSGDGPAIILQALPYEIGAAA